MLLTMLYSAERIAAEVRRLATEIACDADGDELLLVVVLQGAFIFAADLVRQMHIPLTVDFVRVASYDGRETTGKVVITKDLETSITGKKIVVVEDIVDTGLTLAFLLDLLRKREPKSVRVCTLIDKPARRRVKIIPDYVGMVCDRGFLVGYGLDIDGKLRELPAVYEVDSLQHGGFNDSTM